MNESKLSRRTFVQQLGMASGSLILPFSSDAFLKNTSLTFGIVADPHADLIPDKNERLEKFVQKAISKQVDFIIQIGDFCFPKKENLDFMSLWNQYKGPKYHVLGNHDMDVSSKEETLDFWEANATYYSFDEGPFHFVVLDANYILADGQYIDYKNANFYIDSSLRTFINPEQIEWLKGDLQQTNKPTIVFSHQSLLNALWGIKNRVQIQQILEKENHRVGFQKIIACFNGHDHIDFHRTINNIHYIEVNSMSYQWLGKKYSNTSRYAPELYKKYQNLDKLAPYKDPLFAFVELDLKKGILKMEGSKSEWLAPSPKELKVPDQVPGNVYSPEIKDKKLSFR